MPLKPAANVRPILAAGVRTSTKASFGRIRRDSERSSVAVADRHILF